MEYRKTCKIVVPSDIVKIEKYTNPEVKRYMGNRILKESILYSRSLSCLSWFERVMFDNLIVTVDDYGISFADPLRVSRMLFPANANVTEKMVREGLDHLEEQNLIFRYTVRGEEFLKLVSWEKHQRLRNSRRKFPAPEDADPDKPQAAQEEGGMPISMCTQSSNRRTDT